MYFLRKILLIVLSFNSSFLLGQNLVAHYPFDNDVKDISGNNNNGEIKGGVEAATDRFGNPCGALFFDGIDGYIEVPNSISLNSPTYNLSVSCWFKIENLGGSDLRWLTLICKGDESLETITNPHFRVQSFQSSSQSTISINSDFTEYDVDFLKHTFEYGKWNFYTMVYDRSIVKVYLNNKKIWEFAYNKELNSNDAPLHIAKDIPGATEYYHGALDDLRIYNGVLTEGQISSLFNNTTSNSYDESVVLQCPENINVNTQKGKCSSVVNFQEPSIQVNCGSGDVKQIKGLPSGSSFPVGNNTVVYKAESSTGLNQTCIFNVNVNDVIPPEIKCQRDTVIYLNEGRNTMLFSYANPIAHDNCKVGEIQLLEGIESGEEYPIGTTTNTFKAIDLSGNFTTCSFDVIVKHKEGIKSPEINPIKVNNDTLKSFTSKKEETKILDGKPKKIGNDSIKYFHDLPFDECVITLVMFDDGQQDNDTISVFYNDRLIVDREMIKNRNIATIIRAIVLDPTKDNYLVVKAWNNGETSPNTLKIEFYNGNLLKNTKLTNRRKPNEVKLLHSKPGLAGAITLKCKL